MNKILFLATLFAMPYSLCAQSTVRKIIVRDHTNNTTYSQSTIEILKPFLNDGKFETALSQGGIIGNDFFQPEEIGKVKNTNDWGTATDYYPIDGYKRTFCGRLIKSDYADDGDFNMVYNIPFTNPLLQQNFKALNAGNLYYDWNQFEGEIKYDGGFRDFYPEQSPNIQFQPFGCMYGAWVKEWAGAWNPANPTNSDGSHKDNNEIHPAEQGWTINQEYMGKNNRIYNLYLAIDNSGKFNSYSNYDGRPKKLWSTDTLNGIFAFAFEIDRTQKEKISVNIKANANKNASVKTNDGNKHFLIFQNDTLVSINEESSSELMNTDFYNVGYTSTGNNIIKGFFIIKTNLGRPGTHHGNLGLTVSYKKMSSIRQQVKFTLVSIKRLQNNSYRYYDNSIHRLFTYPEHVPNDFNEKSVCVTFGQGQTKKLIPIASLENNDEYIFNDISYNWEGAITDQYFINISCSQNASPNSIPLGSTGIGGYPVSSRTAVSATMLRFDKPDLEKPGIINGHDDQNNEGTYTIVNTSLFEIKYKVEILPKLADKHIGD